MKNNSRKGHNQIKDDGRAIKGSKWIERNRILQNPGPIQTKSGPGHGQLMVVDGNVGNQYISYANTFNLPISHRLH